MNKLYIIKWTLKNGYVLSVSYFWNYTDMLEKMAKNPEWIFSEAENNNIHCIYIAR